MANTFIKLCFIGLISVSCIAAIPVVESGVNQQVSNPSELSPISNHGLTVLDPDGDEIPFWLIPYEDLIENLGEDFSLVNLAEESSSSRVKRQAVDRAMELSLSHNDRNGNQRPVGRLHGFGEARVNGNNGRNYNANLQGGVGSVLWRSRNNRHSVGVGAAVEQNRGRYMGYRYRSRPNVGVGLGYRFRF